MRKMLLRFASVIPLSAIVLISFTTGRSTLALTNSLGRAGLVRDSAPVRSAERISDSTSPSSIVATVSEPLLTQLRINEVVFLPEGDGYEWVEVKNEGSEPINIGGFALTDEDGNWYVFPDDLPSMPSGAFAVVLFDGLGGTADDLDFSDNVANLHTLPDVVRVFEDEGDQIALYSEIPPIHVFLPLVLRGAVSPTSFLESRASTSVTLSYDVLPNPVLISFVAWGTDPLGDLGAAADMGLWGGGTYVYVGSDGGVEFGEGESIGLLPDSYHAYADNWTPYPMSEVTYGEENPAPAINSYHPNAGDTLDSATFAVAWNLVEGAIGYRFQLDDNVDFASPYTDTVVGGPAYVAPSPIPEGVYYWRVQTLLASDDSAWSPGLEVRSLEYPEDAVSAQAAQNGLLEIEWQLQRKDTSMLCLYGGPETGEARWDSPHPETGAVQPHAVSYCSRAALSMFVSYYGAKLSQDRIAYHDFQSTTIRIEDTYNTLGHGQCNDLYMSELLTWANMPTIQLSSPTYEQIKGWIDEERPMVAWVSRYGRDRIFRDHFVVIDGYRELTEGELTYEQLHVLDPWDSDQWPLCDEYRAYIKAVYVGPNYCPVDILQDSDDEYRIDRDSDSDGICDFDEYYRFHTDPYDPDSDDDGVPDKADLREYVFSPDTGRWSLRRADWDSDRKRKELDPDNDHQDNDSSPDGCEDTNRNGEYERDLKETSNYDPAQDQEKECGPFGPVIDFEAAPGDDGILGTPDDIQLTENTLIENQYSAVGIRFYLVQGGLPKIATEGPPEVGFRSVHGLGLDDAPAPSGINTLTDGYTLRRDIGVEFAFPVSSAGLTLIDFRGDSVDGSATPGYTVFLRAYDAERVLVSSDSYTTTGEEPEIFLVGLQVDGPGIRWIELEGSGVDAGIGVDDLLISYPSDYLE